MLTMTNHNNGDKHDLPALIRQQIHDRSNQRFLRTIPVFRADDDVPDEFDDLLERLEQVEKKRPN